MKPREHPRADLYMADREKGMTYQQIADKHGVSRQTVASSLGIRGVGNFRPFTPERCVYPNLRKWLNDNKVSAREFTRRMGNAGWGRNTSTVGMWFRGEGYPQKKAIDRMLEITGLTYEQLFAREAEGEEYGQEQLQ